MMKSQTDGSTGSFHMENFRRRSRYAVVFAVMAAALFAILILNINTGTTNIPVSRILKIIFLREGAQTEYNIIWKIRMPRLLMAAILGGALSLSGFLLQTFFENPIAGPYLLGISSGAKMVVALAMIYFLEKFNKVSSYTLVIAAFIGSLIATGFILLVSRQIKHMATLLIAGTMIGYICSAITDFMITFAEDSDIVNLHGWSQGSFSGMSWSNVKISALIIAVAVILTFMLSKPIGAYQLAEHGRKHKSIQSNADSFVKCVVCDGNCICRTDFFRRYCSPASGKTGTEYIQTTCCYTGDIPGRCCFLYAE